MEKLKKQYAEEPPKTSATARRREMKRWQRKFTFLLAVINSKNALRWEKADRRTEKAMQLGVDLNSEEERNQVFGNVTFPCAFIWMKTVNVSMVPVSSTWHRSRIRMTGARSVVKDRYRIPGSHDFPEPHHHDRKTDHFHYHEASGCSEVEARAKAWK